MFPAFLLLWAAPARSVIANPIYQHRKSPSKSIQLLKLEPLSNQVDSVKLYVRRAQTETNRTLAINYYEQALRLNLLLNNNEGVATNLLDIGNIYEASGKSTMALEYYQKGLTVAEKSDNKGLLARGLMSTADIYELRGPSPKSLDYFIRALQLFSEVNDSLNMARANEKIANHYCDEENHETAIQFHQKALDIHTRIGQKGPMAMVLGNMANCYYDVDELVSAWKCQNRSLEINNEIWCRQNSILNYNGMGNIAHEASDSIASILGINPSSKYKVALDYHLKGLTIAKEYTDTTWLEIIWDNINWDYRDMGDFKNAYDAFVESVNLRNIISAKNVKNEITRLETKFDADKTQAELRYQHQLTREKFLRSKQELESKDRELRLSNQEKEIQKLVGTKQQALLQKEISEKKEQEKLLTINEQKRQLQEAELGQRLFQRNSFMAGVVFLFLLSVLLYRNFAIQKKSSLAINHTNSELSSALSNLKETQEQLIIVEKQKQMAIEKTRIARDMHDDIGSGLTRIAMMSERLKSETSGDEKQLPIRQISNLASELVDNMSQIIWAMNPDNDKMENILGYLRKFSLDYFDNTPVVCEFVFPPEINHLSLTQAQRRNLFLVIKETYHNILKHAAADRVSLEITWENQHLLITINDNGRGFDPNKIRNGGNGLRNMQSRMVEIGGDYKITSSFGKGTQTCLNLGLEKLPIS